MVNRMTTLPTSNLRPETASTTVIATERRVGNAAVLHWENRIFQLSRTTETQLLNVTIQHKWARNHQLWLFRFAPHTGGIRSLTLFRASQPHRGIYLAFYI